MSGFLGAAVNPYISSSTRQLVTGNAPTGPRLLLDGVEFRHFEIPDELPIGGTQALAVHKAIGGKRVVDAMGADHAPINWSGLLFGPLAETKARRLDLLRMSGRAVELTYSGFAWRVVVSSFTARLKANWQIPYTIECTVVEDLVVGAEPEQTATLEEQLDASLKAAETAAQISEALLQAVVDVQIAVRTAMRGRAVLRGLGRTALATLTQAAVLGAANVAAQAVTANAALGAAGAADGMAGVVAGGDPSAMAGLFAGAALTAGATYAAQTVAAEMTVTRATVGQVVP
jgi:hypothetical protein